MTTVRDVYLIGKAQSGLFWPLREPRHEGFVLYERNIEAGGDLSVWVAARRRSVLSRRAEKGQTGRFERPTSGESNRMDSGASARYRGGLVKHHDLYQAALGPPVP